MGRRNLAVAKDAFTSLIGLGGRPTRPIRYEAEPYDDSEVSDEELWRYEQISRSELEKWRSFRTFQGAIRKDEASFTQTQNFIDNFWKRAKIRVDLKPGLVMELQDQTKVDEWKEFYLHQRLKLDKKIKAVARAERQARSGLTESEITAHKSQQAVQEAADVRARWIDTARKDHAIWLAWLEWIGKHSMNNQV